jgi:hypothetical protein
VASCAKCDTVVHVPEGVVTLGLLDGDWSVLGEYFDEGSEVMDVQRILEATFLPWSPYHTNRPYGRLYG